MIFLARHCRNAWYIWSYDICRHYSSHRRSKSCEAGYFVSQDPLVLSGIAAFGRIPVIAVLRPVFLIDRLWNQMFSLRLEHAAACHFYPPLLETTKAHCIRNFIYWPQQEKQKRCIKCEFPCKTCVRNFDQINALCPGNGRKTRQSAALWIGFAERKDHSQLKKSLHTHAHVVLRRILRERYNLHPWLVRF